VKSGLMSGFGYALEGLRLIFRPGLRAHVLVPVLVNLVVLILAVWGGSILFEDLLQRFLPEEGWLSYLRWLLWPLFALGVALLVVLGFTAMANLIAAPFNSLLSQKVEQLFGGKPAVSLGWRQMAGELPRTLGSEVRKLGYFLARAIPLLILFLIPGVNLAAPLLWALFSAWFMALEYSDYPLGNQGLHFSEQRQRLRRNRLAALGFGAGASLLTLIPLVNLAAMPAAVIGATLLSLRSPKPQDPALTKTPGTA
jgi:CysZ protein